MAKIIDTDVTEQEDNSTEFASLTEEQPAQEAPAEPAEEATEAVVESEVDGEEAVKAQPSPKPTTRKPATKGDA